MFIVKPFDTLEQMRPWARLHVDREAMALLCCQACGQVQQQNCRVIEHYREYMCITCHVINPEPLLTPDASQLTKRGAYFLRVFLN